MNLIYCGAECLAMDTSKLSLHCVRENQILHSIIYTFSIFLLNLNIKLGRYNL